MLEKLSNYLRAISRLREAVEEQNVNSYVYDSAIQRFELFLYFTQKGSGAIYLK